MIVRTVRPAVLATMGEVDRGAAHGRRSVLGLVDDGTEIDGAILLDAAVLGGPEGNAGRIGHVCVDPFGPICTCGAQGCLTAVASTAAVERWATEHGFTDDRTCGATTIDDVARAAWAGEAVALASVRRAGYAVGLAAAGAVSLLDVDVVVVCGPLVRAAGQLFLDAVDDGYRRHAGPGHAAAPRVVPGALGDAAARIGAAVLAQRG